MSVFDRVAERIGETLSDWTGYTAVPVEELDVLHERSEHFGELHGEAEELAAGIMDYVGSRPQEVTALRRRQYAQKSRIAFIHDPLAGAEANLRANFALGRGVSKPQAVDKDVQKVIDDFWEHPINQHKLTSFEALRHRSNELLTSANLFPVYFAKNGNVIIGFLDADLITDIVTDPEDDELPMYFVARKRRSEWDFNTHRPSADLGYERGQFGMEKVYYYEHIRFADDVKQWAEDLGRPAPPGPKPADIAAGRVAHIRINRVGRTQFGTPPWTRVLRFFSAMNQLTEAQVNMRQAAASVIAKRVRKGGPNQIMKAAGNLMNRTGTIGAARFGGGAFGAGHGPNPAGPGTDPSVGRAPMPPGSHWMENESDTLQAVNLSSGASQAAQDAQIVRAPIAAAGGFGQHYFGDASNTDLAGATSLELPTLMEVSAWQETIKGLLTLSVDVAIEEAVRAGRLGGAISESEEFRIGARPLRTLRLTEDQAEMEARTGKDLSYSFEMPYPGRRNLPDVVQMVTTMAAAYDPQGLNVPLRRKLLYFLAAHGLQAEDPAAWVDEVMPEDGEDIENPGNSTPAKPAAPQQVSRSNVPDDQKSINGEKRRSQPPGREMGGRPGKGLGEGFGDDHDPVALIEMLDEEFGTELAGILRVDSDQQFEKLLADPAALLAGRKVAPTGRADADGAATSHPVPE